MHTIEDRLVEAGLTIPDRDGLGLSGFGAFALFGPDGELVDGGFFRNLVTQVGDQFYGERASGIGSPPAQVTGMQLGTGSTAAAKTGAGAAIGTFVSGSGVAIDGGYPTSGLNGSSRRITWQTTWPAGTATATGIAEVAIVNTATLGTVASSSNTIARAVLGTTVNKAAGDSLVVTWYHDLLGA